MLPVYWADWFKSSDKLILDSPLSESYHFADNLRLVLSSFYECEDNYAFALSKISELRAHEGITRRIWNVRDVHEAERVFLCWFFEVCFSI